MREAFGRAGAEVAYVDGTAPVIPLLVARIENALDRTPPSGRRLLGLTVTDGAACLEVSSTCRVRLVAYRLDLLYRTWTDEVFEGVLAAGEHRNPLEARVVKGQSFLVARSTGSVLIATVARRETARTRRPRDRVRRTGTASAVPWDRTRSGSLGSAP
ncbi:hypothetical protein [Streptomyces sp. NPDC060035]|uniref:hypothetical protein n=1 Tax=Streptomyces sp. NPDC060035 TaxID=3347044 RepID=UPI0036B087C7